MKIIPLKQNNVTSIVDLALINLAVKKQGEIELNKMHFDMYDSPTKVTLIYLEGTGVIINFKIKNKKVKLTLIEFYHKFTKKDIIRLIDKILENENK